MIFYVKRESDRVTREFREIMYDEMYPLSLKNEYEKSEITRQQSNSRDTVFVNCNEILLTPSETCTPNSGQDC
jgi:hypothetical protein